MVDFEQIIKYFSGKANPEEAEQVEDFAKFSPEQHTYFQSLHQSWLLSGDEIYNQPDIQKEWEYFCSQQNQTIRRKIKWQIPAIAASIAIILGVSGYFIGFNSQPKMMIAKATEAMALSLPDHTQVALTQGAELQYPKAFDENNRVVRLKGNAGFSVSHNPQQPFIIQLPHGLQIRVTGTEFSVKETAAEVAVDLKKGSVLFYNKTDSLPIAAGQTGVYLLSESKFLLKPIAAKSGSFQFSNQALSSVALQLERFFGVAFHFQNPKIANCLFTAGINDKNIEQITEIIALTFNLNYKIEGKNIYLDGDGCP